jgi:hypothetical protein
MTLDWQVLVVAFLALSLRLVIGWTELNVGKTEDELHGKRVRSPD